MQHYMEQQRKLAEQQSSLRIASRTSLTPVKQQQRLELFLELNPTRKCVRSVRCATTRHLFLEWM